MRWRTKLELADAIVWLDLPWYVSMPRIVTRHIKLSWAGTNRHPGIIKLLRFFIAYIPFYTEKTPRKPKARDDDSTLNRVGLERYLQPYKGCPLPQRERGGFVSGKDDKEQT